MTVRELIALLQAEDPEAEVLVDRGGAYGDVRSVSTETVGVFVSADES